MQINLADFVKSSPESVEIETILRSCVHCGFCNATCPTYLLTGDELDGPRGRIYLLKRFFEGQETGKVTQSHLDRCLSCRSCETTCPSGVRYSRLLDLGRERLSKSVARPLWQRVIRRAMVYGLSQPQRFARYFGGLSGIRMQLPQVLRRMIPERQRLFTENPEQQPTVRPAGGQRVLLLTGCVQPTLAPHIDTLAMRIFAHANIELVPVEVAGCCGALAHHLSDVESAHEAAKRNIEACMPFIEQGVDAITMTASGCGLHLKEYADVFRYDPVWASKAQRFSALVKDPVELLTPEALPASIYRKQKIAFQSPCSLQHGHKLAGRVESLLKQAGLTLTRVANSHLCCGSAGTYSILQPSMAQTLRSQKWADLTIDSPDLIATANIGCLCHLQSEQYPILHWLQLFDPDVQEVNEKNEIC